MDTRLSTAAAWRPVRRMALWAVVLMAICDGSPLAGQYISPGITEKTDAIPEKSVFDDNIKNSSWDAGPVRLSPWLGIRDASFVSTQAQEGAETEDDFTATVGAGLRAYLPTSNLMWTAHALPEYVWWEDDEDKRGLNGRYGLGLFGYFNRLHFEVSQRRNEQQGFFSSEVQELTTTRVDTSRLSVEVEVARHLEVFGTAQLDRFESNEDDREIFSRLDRDEETLSIGLRYRSPRGWVAGLALEDESTEFDADARNLSNSGTSEVFELGFDGGRAAFRLVLAFRDLEADEGSEFGTFDETTGALEALFNLSPRTTLLTYARRSQSLSVALENAFAIAETQGARFNYASGRAVFGLFAEIGEVGFETVSSARVDRVDDVTAFGADLRFDVGDLLSLTVNVLHTDYDSNIDLFDRDITNFGVGLQLGALIEKLRLGEAAGDW